MKIHIVQKGDTLWEISKDYGVDFEEVKQLNSQFSSPDMIMPGMKVKIPGSSKTVKQKPDTQHPYKDTTPKKMPVITEDDKAKPKALKPEIPVQPLPQMPISKEKPMPISKEKQMPIEQEKPMPIPKEKPMLIEKDKQQMPVMQQKFHHHTTVNFPKMPQYTKPQEELPIKEKEHIKPQMLPEPQPQPMHMLPMCCHVVHPYYPPIPFPAMGALPEAYGPPQHPMVHPDPSFQMAGPPMQKEDCGCNKRVPSQHHQMMPFGDEFQHYQPDFNSQQSMPQQMPPKMPEKMPQSMPQQQVPPNNMYPPHFGNHGTMDNHPYPTPPAYPEFSTPHYREDEDPDLNE
ncbi:morphogenetic protein associated with SpoVID [Virgibacillus natechei]|uniref:Morphogenetic protein associated with SpoVID n=1 Tax=Virgibacillus natechei TaxID=1216297 RepID=A0ABS4ICY8_9BACI|nr:SafA/ExsA family spore coat assembly protein [Virgibacillus natechei]MBP1968788.1 morphogenetic protein associated with SpoVID [Virgibacillus natechei]UZD11587.1 SafA/ExsA family spore coat assembly protein [Virgibacillus natechei]